jgi:hypothetical protein
MFRSFRSRVLVVVPLLAVLAAASVVPVGAAGSNVAITPPINLTPVPQPTLVINIVSVPDCTYLTQTGCQQLLTANGLRLGSVTFLAPSGPPPYVGSHVVAQSPAPGTLTLRGASVNISIQPFGPPFRP